MISQILYQVSLKNGPCQPTKMLLKEIQTLAAKSQKDASSIIQKSFIFTVPVLVTFTSEKNAIGQWTLQKFSTTNCPQLHHSKIRNLESIFDERKSPGVYNWKDPLLIPVWSKWLPEQRHEWQATAERIALRKIAKIPQDAFVAPFVHGSAHFWIQAICIVH